MKPKSNKKNNVLKIITNPYAIIIIFFVIWMLFIDENSYLYHQELNKDIKELKKINNFHKQKIKENKKIIKKLQDSFELERYAREKYLMKKKDEDVFIIEFDTVKKTQK